MTGMTVRTLGVDEEFLLVDVVTGRPAPGPEPVVTATPALGVLDDLRGALAALRRDAGRAAERRGAALVASGSSPVPARGRHAPSADRRPATPAFGAKVLEQPTCGCHVHVGVASLEEAAAAIDRVRPWVPVLLAVSANSPFWRGSDTDYASYRTQVRGPLASDLRLSGRSPSPSLSPSLSQGPAVEVRVADAALDVDGAVLVAALARGLVDTAAREWRQGRPAPVIRPELVRLATWRASRSGLSGVLVDVATRAGARARARGPADPARPALPGGGGRPGDGRGPCGSPARGRHGCRPPAGRLPAVGPPRGRRPDAREPHGSRPGSGAHRMTWADRLTPEGSAARSRSGPAGRPRWPATRTRRRPPRRRACR